MPLNTQTCFAKSFVIIQQIIRAWHEARRRLQNRLYANEVSNEKHIITVNCTYTNIICYEKDFSEINVKAFSIFFYSSQYFEEVTNFRNFDKDDLWASIGGVVGMILGLSFLQLTDIICEFIQRLIPNQYKNKEPHEIK